ncbi:hypothetical protein LEP1GSC079_1345 [Leptospira interrogans str. FPW1039]|uniref:Uncharacterized protein n=1 Tax=Leptospira interrogans str. FPW1039 TaxID=1193040 RepID=A0A0F6IF40_LEPIR|nr:hypothetical protein LEP1GSC045_0547 [Leptospira interrogans serovar Pomona str. Kennewicki LC82-25]EKN95937.1 hypothetical protein LEP1GSC014_4319 [Leptospira interrogans serovar Pomona str. Pomona]EKR38201.1 hypothetical protein LEP1GSC096_0808 [Leptospira interrogans serovar Hebdomadis str. R499]EMF34628.1 hypothetical protein LEP1GSC201_3804 [Leptospira interrogans serovar Pomona str. Fox 32256]EMI65652.1 hypothetical protein LEP1GSC200_2105 [Leptospira interrogans serovar Pomona str. CS
MNLYEFLRFQNLIAKHRYCGSSTTFYFYRKIRFYKIELLKN